MKAIIADTGPLYACIDTDDQYYKRAQRELERINQEKLAIILLYPIYLETHKLVLQWLGVSAALNFSQEISKNVNLINPSPFDYEAANRLLLKFPDQKISLFDAVIAILSEQTKLTVWTYDYHFDVMKTRVWR